MCLHGNFILFSLIKMHILIILCRIKKHNILEHSKSICLKKIVFSTFILLGTYTYTVHCLIFRLNFLILSSIWWRNVHLLSNYIIWAFINKYLGFSSKPRDRFCKKWNMFTSVGLYVTMITFFNNCELAVIIFIPE